MFGNCYNYENSQRNCPIPRTELFKKSPLYSLPLEWNNFDDNKYIRNRVTFKTALKYSLLNSLIDGLEANGVDLP